MTPCYFFSFDHAGFITRINDTLLNDLGYRLNEVENIMKLESLLTVGSKIFFQTHFYPIIKLHGKANEIFLSFQTKNKEEIPVLLNVKSSGSDKQLEVHCGGMQITQRNRFEREIIEAKRIAEDALQQNHELVKLQARLEEKSIQLESQLRTLRQKNSEQRQMSTILSHDIQEPLRKISIFTDLLLTEKIESESIRISHLLRMSGAAAKMRKLVVSMQQFLTLENYKIFIVTTDLDVILSKAKIKAEINAADVNIAIEGHSPKLNVDINLFVSLFYELFTNSLKFHDPDIPLKITITTTSIANNIYREVGDRYQFKEFIKLTYTDNGIGFDNKYADEIFNMFRKAHTNEEGSGIGLTYCTKIMDLHQGSITARSEKSSGTTFTILLPKD